MASKPIGVHRSPLRQTEEDQFKRLILPIYSRLSRLRKTAELAASRATGLTSSSVIAIAEAGRHISEESIQERCWTWLEEVVERMDSLLQDSP